MNGALWFQKPVPPQVEEALNKLLVSCQYWSSAPLNAATIPSDSKAAEVCLVARSPKTLTSEAIEVFYTGTIVGFVMAVWVWGFCRVVHGIWIRWRTARKAMEP